jgi:hypothetical protein
MGSILNSSPVMQRGFDRKRVTKVYEFDGPDGGETLADLFGGRSQLIVYHFMFHPDDKRTARSERMASVASRRSEPSRRDDGGRVARSLSRSRAERARRRRAGPSLVRRRDEYER